jgi:hypothetical protein
MDDSDIQVAFGGHRMCWRAVSERARAWVDAQAGQLDAAPEGVECLIRYGEPILASALADGLIVMAGDVEVSLCQ